MKRRIFMRLLAMGGIAAGLPVLKQMCIPEPQPMDTRCACGERVIGILIPGERRMVCFYCATADEVNAWLHTIGLRPCPHSEHSSDEEFQQCKQS
jgi:hypothetical protein